MDVDIVGNLSNPVKTAASESVLLLLCFKKIKTLKEAKSEAKCPYWTGMKYLQIKFSENSMQVIEKDTKKVVIIFTETDGESAAN